jgi:hypothetical protein
VAADDGDAVFRAAGFGDKGRHIGDGEAEGLGFLQFGVVGEGMTPYDDEVYVRGDAVGVPARRFWQ